MACIILLCNLANYHSMYSAVYVHPQQMYKLMFEQGSDQNVAAAQHRCVNMRQMCFSIGIKCSN